MKIGLTEVGGSAPCFIIAEIAQAHDGSLGSAHAYIDAVAKTGVNAIKFQTHIAAEESSPLDVFRVNIFPQDKTRYDYWRRMEFSPEQWKDLCDHANEKGLIFLSSAFSNQAVRILESINMPAWKIASGEINNFPMIEEMARSKKPFLISSGMSSFAEIDNAVNFIDSLGCESAVFQCTTSYPCPPEEIGLNILDEMQEKFQRPIGLSDHSGTPYPALAAASLGIDLLEIHAVLSKDSFGPDTSSSLTISELTELVRGIRYIEKMLNSPIDKDAQANSKVDLKMLFSKSLYSKSDLRIGHVLLENDIAIKKPGNGMPANDIKKIIGKKLTKDILLDSPFTKEHF
ncbi:N-acetylneuraminate synthase family protein [Gammaproteobacteria bacterium]|jgi:N,N'-diacetyllegionaminate synthase|nr:N-acetylneuraminate synthase family protein [Gammaproteobacteria bacterium]